MAEPKKLLVFLSHASEDKPAVRRLCKRLKADGFDPWLDEERLLPGQDWNLEIEKAMQARAAILLCFSSFSVAKEGYIQREYKRAMHYQEEKPEGTIFIIPVQLDDCEMPFFIRELEWVDFPAGYNRLVKALNLRGGKDTLAETPKKKEQDKKPPAKKRASRPTIHIEGGIHAGQIVMGDQKVYNARRDIIKGNQNNTIINYAPIQSSAELATVLNQLLAQVAALRQDSGLSSAQRGIVQSAEQKIAVAAEEAAKPEPIGERIETTLTEAKEYMDVIGGSLASAGVLGTTIGTLLVWAAKMFSL
jgi:hypothetical protein